MNTLGSMAGFKIITDINMVDYHIRIIKRSWTERLFTIPWKPLNNTKEEIYTTPKESVFILSDNNTVVMHPDMVEELTRGLNE